ncbi:MAG: aldehyde ferredoxin oxidoreductase family protein [Aminobacteriaceae bacterium]
MEKLFGYAGTVLWIDLTSGGISRKDLSAETIRPWLGGTGYAARLLFDGVPPGADPLGPENLFILATGPLTDNVVPGGGSLSVCCKSPLTGGWGEARVGCDFGPELKRAGYDFVVLSGVSDRPLHIVITDGTVELRDGAFLAGRKVLEREKLVRELDGLEDHSILTIGPAGEKGVLFASVMVGHRAAGRIGAGAVLGSKNVAALSVKGTGRIAPADPAAWMREVRAAHGIVKENPNTPGFTELGTMGGYENSDRIGDLPTKNWQSNSWGKGEAVSSHFFGKNQVASTGCYKGCPMKCGRKVRVENGPWKTPEHDGGEYETVGSFTAYVLNEDVDCAVHCGYLCNELGIDTISTGAVIGFLFECAEKGLVSLEAGGGLDLSWGNGAVLPRLVEMIALREGIGDILADGVRRAAETIGGGAERFAVHVKGLEGPCHDPRAGKTLAVSYGTGNRGMCHIHPLETVAYDCSHTDFGLIPFGLPDPNQFGRWDEEGKGEATRILQDGGALPDILGTCKFYMYVGITPKEYAAMLSALTGWKVTGEELLETAERVTNLQRLFNCREGFGREQDRLPDRARSLPAFGKYAGSPESAVRNYDLMLDEYYDARGWDRKTGAPLEETLLRLGIEG